MPPWSTFLVRHSTKSHHFAVRWRISLAKAGSSSRFQTSRRSISTSPAETQPDQFHRTRNIGIIAHIDAGKTTTTERMLYYSGHTKRIGDVDDGSTVTDFLPAERARGITIQSAAITFQWPPVDVKQPVSAGSSERPRSELPHQVNLIDTPGHADFTFEVRRSLRVLDGAICILDGVAGVEAQTEQVWKQAGEWKIPRLAYINKLDRDGAAFGRTVKEIAVKLGGWPALCQIPWFEGGKGLFCGVGDVINLGALHYEQGGDGKTVRHYSLDELAGQEPMLADELRRARVALVELLSEHDDAIVDAFLEANEDHLSVSPHALWESLRRCLIKNDSTVIPVFAGASFRNIGVQPLLDAVNNLLPSPSERLAPEITVGEAKANLEQFLTAGLAVATSKKASAQNVQTLAKSLKGCALAFKVVNDTRKGMLVYFRVYSGTIDRNDVLFNTNLKNSERATNLLRMYASESVPVQSVSAGQIGVIAGSKHARTGDTLISYSSNKATPPPPLDQLQLRPIQIPPPVFFASLEPNSLREEKDMHEKLSILLREDPSLQVSQDEDTGQTLISGMGELHLEIARDRLVGDLKANARMGNIAIGYRETFNQPSTNVSKIFDKDRSDAKGRAGCTSMVEPLIDSADNLNVLDDTACVHVQDGNYIVVVAPTLDKKGRPATDDNVSLPSHLNLKEIQTAYINGALAALSRGPSYSYPVRGVLVKITLDPEQHIFGPETTYSALTAAARLATITAFRDAAASGGSALMEPVMNVDISVDDASLGSVIQDISSTRGGHIISLGDGEGDDADARQDAPKIDPSKVYAPLDPFEFGNSADNNHNINLPRSIKAKVPLREMVGYLKHLRSMTGGRGTFVMSVDQFVKMTGPREKALINELRGQV